MCQKSVINDPKTVVSEMLEGISYAYPGLYVVPDKGIVMINRDRKDKVALLCGCGAGYEPFAAGYVGEGMLTGYVSGKLGKAPRSNVILSVITYLAELNRGGVLILILNYPREVLNFGLAVERARCLGLRVESIVLVDDCCRWKAMRKEHYTNLAYKKGLCGCVFAFKILGGLSSAGASMSFMVSEARALNFRTTTLGFCLEPFCYPGSDRLVFSVASDNIIIGLGINGENGIKIIERSSVEDVIKQVMPMIYEETNLNAKSAVFVLINKLSSMTTIESYIIAKEVYKYLAKKVQVLRLIVGCFFTSFDAKGAHISILNVTGKAAEWLNYFEMETEAFAWPNTKLSSVNPKLELMPFTEEKGPEIILRESMQLSIRDKRIFRKCLEAAFESLIDAEVVLNQLNAYNGNGDCGTKLKDFSIAALQRIVKLPLRDVSTTFQLIERVAEETMTGHIGALYSMLLCGAGYSATSWAECVIGAIRYLGVHFPIVSGYRTLWDVVKPAFLDFADYYNFLGEELWRAALQLSVDTAEKACYETSKMLPKVGVYNLNKKLNMDAGAYSVLVWMRAVNDMLKELLPLGSLPPDADWRYKLEALLLSQRPSQRLVPLKYRYELHRLPYYLSDFDEEGEEEQEGENWLQEIKE